MTCLFGRIQVELNSESSISDLYVAWGLDVKYPRSLALCIRRILDLSVKIHVKKCVLYTRNYGSQQTKWSIMQLKNNNTLQVLVLFLVVVNFPI